MRDSLNPPGPAVIGADRGTGTVGTTVPAGTGVQEDLASPTLWRAEISASYG